LIKRGVTQQPQPSSQTMRKATQTRRTSTLSSSRWTQSSKSNLRTKSRKTETPMTTTKPKSKTTWTSLSPRARRRTPHTTKHPAKTKIHPAKKQKPNVNGDSSAKLAQLKSSCVKRRTRKRKRTKALKWKSTMTT
jgi:hypothetical protein